MHRNALMPAPTTSRSTSDGTDLAIYARSAIVETAYAIKARSGSDGIAPAMTPAKTTRIATLPARSPSGFTLVELLVVIVILAMLASLVTVAASRAMTAARNAAIKAEIDMLHMAIMNYKNEYGSFPPCSTGNNVITGTDAASNHLKKLFPRIQTTAIAATQATRLGYLNTGTGSITRILPETALVPWLYGYNEDPQYPVYSLDGSGNPISRKKLFDFDQSRITNMQYSAKNTNGSPIIYITSSQYNSIDYATNSNTEIGGNRYFVWRRDPSFNPTTTSPISLTAAAAPQAFNPDTFQLLSAGRDGTFFTEDDISNMWSGTWKDYLDSLTQ